MFQPFERQNQIMGYSTQIGEYQIFYGTRYLKRSHLKEFFPDYQFCFVKQVHGKKVVPARTHLPFVEADGHWTDQKKQALVIETADCLPVFLWSGSVICAVHAGWRGVEQKIALSALQCFPARLHGHLKVSIGPHIDQEHFEVDEDVAQKLAQSSPHGKEFLKLMEGSKYQVSLIGIVTDQLKARIPVKNDYFFDKSTFLSKIFHSYRRTAEKLLGQLSFIVRS